MNASPPKKNLLLLLMIVIIVPTMILGQTNGKWKAHDLNRPKPQIITPPAQYLPVPAPSDAVILFDGSDLSKWEGTDGSATKWIAKKDYFECVKGSGYIRTKQGFGDVQLHIEWAAPLPAEGSSQGRGNSGVFLMGRYEVQVLDSYENETYADGQAGAVYGQYPPLVNAARPAGEWQAYDIVFRRPRFDSLGKLLKPARMTVFHNGVLIQDNVELWGGTDWLRYSPYEAHADKLPLALQDHGNPVRYRNVWLRELPCQPENKANYPAVISMENDVLERYAGTYKRNENSDLKIVFEQNKLKLIPYGNREFELLAHSKKHFSAKSTAIDCYFELDENGQPVSLEYQFTGGKSLFKKVK